MTPAPCQGSREYTRVRYIQTAQMVESFRSALAPSIAQAILDPPPHLSLARVAPASLRWRRVPSMEIAIKHLQVLAGGAPWMERDEAEAMRAALGRNSSVKRRTALNIALKFVRKASTDGRGQAYWAAWDLSRFLGSPWPVPAWVRPDKGQYGEFDWNAPPVLVEIPQILAQLPTEDFERIFNDGGVRGAVVFQNSVCGVWWAKETADFDLVIVSATERHHLKPSFSGALAVQRWPLTAALAATDLPPEQKAASRKTWHSAVKPDASFLIGGATSPEWIGWLATREAAGGPDAEVIRFTALEETQNTPETASPPAAPWPPAEP